MYMLNQNKTLGEKKKKAEHPHWREKKKYIIVLPPCSLLFMSELLQMETFCLIPCLSDLYLIHSDDIAKLIFTESTRSFTVSPLAILIPKNSNTLVFGWALITENQSHL